MLPFSPPDASHSALSGGHPFALTQAQLYDEERRLRLLAESQVRSLVAVLAELALVLAPAAVEERKRDDPTALRRMTAPEWQAFFREELARKEAKSAWELSAPSLQPVEELEVVSAEQPASPEPLPELLTPNSSPPTQPAARSPSVLHPATCTPISLPSKKPKPFKGSAKTWRRRLLIVTILGQTGWALRMELLNTLAKIEGISSSSGSIKDLVSKMADEGFLYQRRVQLGETSLYVHWLTDTGKRLVEAVGLVPVPSEWEELLALHGGERQHAHAVLCLVASHQARQHGYATQICPPAVRPNAHGKPGSVAPDLLLVNGDERIYVEVEAESGDPERRMVKWRNLAQLQGFVALCAPTPEIRSRLVAEAKAAKTTGMATDLKTGRNADRLWVEKW